MNCTQMRSASSVRSVRAGRRTAVQVAATTSYTQPVTNKPMDVVFVSAEASGVPPVFVQSPHHRAFGTGHGAPHGAPDLGAIAALAIDFSCFARSNASSG